MTRCIHCGVKDRGDVCPDCLELISDLGEEEYIPPPPRQFPPRDRRFEPSPQELADYLEMTVRGAFRPRH